jgi:hypothetical protein
MEKTPNLDKGCVLVILAGSEVIATAQSIDKVAQAISEYNDTEVDIARWEYFGSADRYELTVHETDNELLDNNDTVTNTYECKITWLY